MDKSVPYAGILATLLATAPVAGSVAADPVNTGPSAVADRCSKLAPGPGDTVADFKTALKPAVGSLPEYCAITGSIEKRTGADGKTYAMAFELRVPSAWNGRFLFQGGGGLNGILFPAVGRQPLFGTTAPNALQRGFAVVSTDSGHIGGTSSFGADQEATINFSYAAIGKVAQEAKRLIGQLAGRAPDKSYYVGCSNGGREAMIAAQRFPMDFDGVVAADPAFNVTDAGLLANYSTQIYLKLSRPELRSPLTQSDLKLVGQAVLKKCDGLDGKVDGMIFAHDLCHFDPEVLACHPGQTSGCLSAAKIVGIRNAFRGPTDKSGKPLFPSWPYDSGIGDAGWLSWQTGAPQKDGKLGSKQNSLVADADAGLFMYPPVDQRSLETLDVERARTAMAPMAGQLDAIDTRMSTFSARGGKMLLITGWDDPIFSANDIARWYQKLVADEKTARGGDATSFARLFMVPGMLHCGGGQSLDDIDLLTALTDWVEKGAAPDRLIAKGHAFPGQSRPLCPYPAYARYSGTGDPADERNYVCATVASAK